MTYSFDPTGYDDSPAIVRVLPGGDTEPVFHVVDRGLTPEQLATFAAAPKLLDALKGLLPHVPAGTPIARELRKLMRSTHKLDITPEELDICSLCGAAECELDDGPCPRINPAETDREILEALANLDPADQIA